MGRKLEEENGRNRRRREEKNAKSGKKRKRFNEIPVFHFQCFSLIKNFFDKYLVNIMFIVKIKKYFG